mmetsp:Transcript_30876/g.45665  ORF Transcript_30876/g.45665 Transcript_30876/m.45665 type:complete len:364 (-) Transcript_30876:1247-2338(-)
MEVAQVSVSANEFENEQQIIAYSRVLMCRKRIHDSDTCINITENRSKLTANIATTDLAAADDVSETPTLILPRSSPVPPFKKLRSEYGSAIAMPPSLEQSTFLRIVPDDVVGYCLSFLNSVQDRSALQRTCRQFRRLSNSDDILASIRLGGDEETGLGGIFSYDDGLDSASKKVSLFARAGNVEALYMLGMIKTFCQPDVEGGILILQRAAKEGYVRAHYTLGLVLRDSHTEEANRHLITAAQADYLPALQEVLPNRDMKTKYGELSAAQLRPYLDSIGLNRFLGRHYLECGALRELNTSHCWNPLCGRWAFKANLMVTPPPLDLRVSRMKMCSRCCRAKYCSKLCQVYDWRSGRHKTECQFL